MIRRRTVLAAAAAALPASYMEFLRLLPSQRDAAAVDRDARDLMRLFAAHPGDPVWLMSAEAAELLRVGVDPAAARGDRSVYAYCAEVTLSDEWPMPEISWVRWQPRS